MYWLKQDCHSNWKVYCDYDEHWGHPFNWISDVRLDYMQFFLIVDVYEILVMHWFPKWDAKFSVSFVKVETVRWMH